MSHTPTPWRAYNATNGRILKHWRIQRDDAKQDIALISLDVPADAREQTAAHIVRCVNSHDDLVAALKAMRAVVGGIDTYKVGGEVRRAIEQTEAALKLAEA